MLSTILVILAILFILGLTNGLIRQIKVTASIAKAYKAGRLIYKRPIISNTICVLAYISTITTIALTLLSNTTIYNPTENTHAVTGCLIWISLLILVMSKYKNALPNDEILSK